MKKKLIVAGLLILLLTLITAIACAEINTVRFKQNKQGSVTVTWKDGSYKGNYEVTYKISSWKTSYYEEKEYDERSATLLSLVPGATYKVTIRRTDGTSTKTKKYTVPKSTFMDWTSGKAVVVEDLKSFITGQDSIYRNIKLKMHYPRIRRGRTYYRLIALRTPKGYSSYVSITPSLDLGRSGYVAMTTTMDFSAWMKRVKQDFGKYPKGEYKFEIYLNGAYYQGGNFFVY